MIYFCCDERRRSAVARHATLNGIDFLEVIDSEALVPADRQRILKLTLIKPLGAIAIGLDNILIVGGERIRNITPTQVATDPASNEVEIRVDQWGDFSRYVLRLVEISGSDIDPLTGFDALLSAVEFSFKVECPSEFDCAVAEECPPELRIAPEIDYLTKDYQGFRRLMLDRITTLIPDWTERHAADFGVSLVELLAYTADYLSYQQDAIATEAYLGTARRRVSIRRHARLVDYRIDEGAAARVWVQVRVKPGQGPVTLPKSPSLIESCPIPNLPAVSTPIRFLTRAPSIVDPPKVIAPGSPEFAQAIAGRVEVFELAEPEARTLFEDQNEMQFYTWGDRECCLPKGATRATLDGHLTSLNIGDVLVLAEKAGPRTNLAADADPAHRHAVRLTEVTLTDDPLFGLFSGEPPSAPPVLPHPVTDIAWDSADALPFPLCLSAKIDDVFAINLAVAYGNIVLADHGMTLPVAEELPNVPASTLSRVLAGARDRCREETEDEQRRSFVPPRYQPVLDRGPLTWTTRVRIQSKAGGTIADDFAPYDRSKPATALVSGETVVLPAVALTEEGSGAAWTARPDLLSSGANAADMAVEMESDARALIRFGDDEYGKRPNPGTAFFAHYRIGNSIRGNIGPDAIEQIVTVLNGIDSATNLVPAWGGRRPETIDEIRQRAPVAFRTQQRAVTAEDYAATAELHPGVQRAVATIQWTGSWRTIFITVDRVGGLEVDQAFEDDLRTFLERFRMAGHDVEIQPPVLVPIAIEMTVCVAPDHFRSDVKAALLDVFSTRVFPDGRRGAFHPDELTFGQSIYLSRLYAAAQVVDGVTSVEITVFQRQGIPASSALETGELKLGRTEIASLDNSASFPDRGVLRITLGGGK